MKYFLAVASLMVSLTTPAAVVHCYVAPGKVITLNLLDDGTEFIRTIQINKDSEDYNVTIGAKFNGNGPWLELGMKNKYSIEIGVTKLVGDGSLSGSATSYATQFPYLASILVSRDPSVEAPSTIDLRVTCLPHEEK